MNLEAIQRALVRAGVDGWLFYDFHNRDPIAYRVLGMDFGKFTSRRWWYWIPAMLVSISTTMSTISRPWG